MKVNDVCLEQVIRKYLRFLRALLNASDETLHDIRFKDPANSEHMQHMPERVRRLWEVGVGLLSSTDRVLAHPADGGVFLLLGVRCCVAAFW